MLRSREFSLIGALITAAIVVGSIVAGTVRPDAADGHQVSSTVITVAGSGLSGNSDGEASKASFMEPFGIAVAADGTIYVSDYAGQRIRAIRNGLVSTVAGSGEPDAKSIGGVVAGGFADGKALEAKFDKPAGIIVLADKTILVADSYNHCIRAIRNGVVSTFAGSNSRIGSLDGPKADATFVQPRALAFDPKSGSIFVADIGIPGQSGALRKIDSSGIVSTIDLGKLAKTTIEGISVTSTGKLFVSDHDSLVVYDPTLSAEVEKYGDVSEGGRRLGYPDQFITFGDVAVFSDARSNAIRLFREPLHRTSLPLSEPLNGPVLADSANNGGGYRDGTIEHALFDLPRGLSKDGSGTIFVADAGNRRIRKILNPDLRVPDHTAVSATSGSPVLIGGQILFYDTLWQNSIPGLVREALTSDVIAIQYDDGSKVDESHTLSMLERAKLKEVIWLLTTRDVANLGIDQIIETVVKIRSSGKAVLVYAIPFANEVRPAQQLSRLALDSPDRDLDGNRAQFEKFRALTSIKGIKFADLSSVVAEEGEADFATLTDFPTDLARKKIALRIVSDLR